MKTLPDFEGKIVVVDLDGTLCTNTYGDYELAMPIQVAINNLEKIREAGAKIIIFTARGSTTGIDWSELTRQQLETWGVRFDQLLFGKPFGHIYIDDRGIHSEILLKPIEEQIAALQFISQS